MPGPATENTALLHHSAVHHAVHGAISSSQDTKAPVEKPIDTSTMLGRLRSNFKSHFKNHEVPLNVTHACLNSLSLYLAANSQLQGFRTTYEKNLNTLNLAFLGFVLIVFTESMFENNIDMKKHPSAYFYLCVAGSFLYMLSFTASNMQAFQADVLAGEVQFTDPSGGANSVSNNTFFEYDFAIPLVVGFAIAFKQFILDIHKLSRDLNRESFTTKISDKIQPLPKKILHYVNVGTEVFVNGGAVFGSGISDLASLIVSFTDINLLKEKQYATTLIYAGSFAIGMGISLSSQLGIIPVSIETLNRIFVASFIAVGVADFYHDNYVNFQYSDDRNINALIAMIVFPVILTGGILAYITHYNCRAEINSALGKQHIDVEQPNFNLQAAEGGLLIEAIDEPEEHLAEAAPVQLSERTAALQASLPVNIAPRAYNPGLFGRANSYLALLPAAQETNSLSHSY